MAAQVLSNPTTIGRRATNWIKRNPIYGLVVVITPVIGLIAALPNTWSAVSLMLGIPPCGKYSDSYYYSTGHFKRSGEQWYEYQTNYKYSFDELSRNREYIILINRTPRTDPRWESMLVRLPVCGGTAQWTDQNPEKWIDLLEVDPDPSPAVIAQQRKLEK